MDLLEKKNTKLLINLYLFLMAAYFEFLYLISLFVMLNQNMIFYSKFLIKYSKI